MCMHPTHTRARARTHTHTHTCTHELCVRSSSLPSLSLILPPFLSFSLFSTSLSLSTSSLPLKKPTQPPAIAELNGREVDGRPIHVREDREQGNPRGPRGPRGPGGPGGFSPRGPPRPGPPPHRTSNFTATFAGEPGSTVYVGGLPYSMRWQGLKDMMRQAGPVEHVEIMYDGFNRSKGCGLVRFATAEDAQNAVRTFNEQTIDGRPLAVRIDAEADKFRQGWSVYVGNLAWEVTWKELKDLMATVGEVIHADVVRDANGYSRGWGTVRFATQEAAQAAIDKFENHELLGRPITVRFDRREHPSLVADEPAADDAQ